MGKEAPCSDIELAAGVARNDEPSVITFFSAYHAGVFRYMLCLTGNWEDAEDLAQDSLLHAKAKIRSYRGESALKTWVHRVAYHTFTHWNRRRKPLNRLDDKLVDKAQSMRSVDAGEALLTAIGQLGPALAHPIVLQEVSGHSIDEIARILDIPSGTVKSRLHFAKQRLREHLGSEENYHA